MTNMQDALNKVTKPLVEFKSDHTSDVSGRGAHTPGGGENAPTARKRRGDRSEGEKGMNKLDSKNSGVEQGKSAKGSPGENKRPADKDGAYKGGMERLDSKSSGLEQGKSDYSQGGQNANQDPMPRLDSKSSGLEPAGYSEEISKEEKFEAILDEMADLTDDEVDELYNSLVENEQTETEEGEEEDDDDEFEPLDPIEIIHKSVKVEAEDLDLSGALGVIFEDGDLSEEFKAKAYDIFETAVLTVVNNVLEQRNEELEENYSAAVESSKDQLVDKIDGYLDAVVSEWAEDNALVIASGIRTEVLEDFVGGLKKLFAEQYVEIPEEKVDLIDSIESRMAELEDRLNREIESNIHTRKELEGYKRESVIYDVCEDLTDLETEKVREFAENIEFTNEKEFTEKVKTVVENYFPKDSAKRATRDELDNLAVGEEVPSQMQRIIDVIQKTSRPRPFSDVRNS